MNDLGYASSPALLQYLKAATDYGISPEALLNTHSIHLDVLTNDITRVKGIDLQRLIADLINQTQDPSFGLKASQYVQPASYSVLGYMVMNCKVLKDAIQFIPKYEKLVGDMGHTEIIPAINGLQMIWRCHYTDSTVRPHMIANVLGSWVNFARFLVDQPEEKASKVYFEFPQPDHDTLRFFQNVFQTTLVFNHHFNGLELHNELLALPIRQADGHLLKTLAHHADIVIANLEDSQTLTIKVQSVIRSLLIESIPRKETVAHRLNMSERTMQRKLKREGTSYQIILDNLRLEQGKELLVNTQLSIQDIATRLGFSEPRSFHRSFKLKVGMTPGEFRDQ